MIDKDTYKHFYESYNTYKKDLKNRTERIEFAKDQIKFWNAQLKKEQDDISWLTFKKAYPVTKCL